MKLLLTLAIVLLTNITVFSQDKKFFVGLNVGVKFANKNYAYRYTGAYNNELPVLLQQQQVHQQIYQILDNKDFSFYEFNESFKYTPAINYGVILGYAVSPNLQASIDANFSQPKVETTFSIEIIDPSNQTSQENIMIGHVLGKEGRFNGKFNLDYIFDGDKAHFIIGLQGLFLSWRMEQLLYELNDEKWIYNAYSVHTPTNNITKKTSGSGWGYGINIGVDYRLNKKLVAQLMYQPYFSRVEYLYTKSQIQNAGSIYPGIANRLEHDLTLRIHWK